MRLKNYILILFAIVFACSCSNKKGNEQLDKVEAIVSERPDSALLLLKSVNISPFENKAFKARYSLLHAMALDKSYIDTTNVDIVMPAVEYYRKHGTPDEKLKAYYYLGRILYNGQDFNKAIITFTQALEYGEKSTDNQYKGRVNLAIADTYANFYNRPEELNYIDKAEKYFRQSDNDKLIDAVVCRKGMAMAKNKEFTTAKNLLLSVLNSSDREIRLEALVNLACIEVEREPKDAKAALTYFREALKEGRQLNVSQCAVYAYVLAETGFSQEAEQIFSSLEKLSPKAKAAALAWQTSRLESAGDYKQALNNIRSVLAYQDSIVTLSLSNSVEKAQSDYFQEKAIAVAAKSKSRFLTMLSIVLGLLLAIIILYTVYRLKLEEERKNRERLIDISDMARRRIAEIDENERNYSKKIDAMHEEVESKEKQLAQLRCKYTEMYKEQFHRLGSLYETYSIANGGADSQRIVYEKVRNLLNIINGDEEGKKTFEDMINDMLDNIMVSFRKDFPNYSEEEYRFISYLFVGFDATSLSFIFNTPSLAAVYMRKSRIKKTIQESQAEFKEKYLEYLA
jgi:tetratricopeptide (TPR) repeat protein